MPTRASESEGLGATARELVDHGVSILRLEARLALAELKGRLALLGVGIALAVGAATCGLLALLLAVATVAAALATAMRVWLALLIVAGGAALLAALFGLVALRALKRATPPIPRQAIEEAKRTAEAVRGNGRARAA